MTLVDRMIARSVPFLPRAMVRRVSARYIAGERLAEAMEVASRLNRNGARATIDVLGESITREDEADATCDEYVRVLDEIERRNLDSNVSIKLTALGLLLDVSRCEARVRRIAEEAAARRNFVRIDMEDSSCTDATIEIYRRVRRDHDNVGIVLQAYLRRTISDVISLSGEGANFRLCKGIYIEPRRIAWRDRAAVRRNFTIVLEEMFRRNAYVGIATHDEVLVCEAMEMIRRRDLSPDRYEFQMLLGVDETLERTLVASGHPLRIYVPYGAHWYAYATRRLRENPAIAGHVARALFARVTRTGVD